MSEIYALADACGHIRYVGKTSATGRKRLGDHLRNARRGTDRQRRLCSWLRSLPQPPSLIVLESDPVGGLDEAERAWIATLLRYGCSLTNMTPGGDGQPKGYVPSAETRAKVSASHKGRVKSDAERASLSRALMGHETSPETRAKIGAANARYERTPEYRERVRRQVTGEGNPFFGRKHTEETRAKMRAARARQIAGSTI